MKWKAVTFALIVLSSASCAEGPLGYPGVQRANVVLPTFRGAPENLLPVATTPPGGTRVLGRDIEEVEGPHLLSTMYPTDGAGNPDYSSRATITANVNLDWLSEAPGGWIANYTSNGSGTRSKIQGNVSILVDGQPVHSVAMPENVADRMVPFPLTWTHSVYTQGAYTRVCDAMMEAYGTHTMWHQYLEINWGHASQNSYDYESTPACGSSGSGSGSGGSEQDEWYICYYYDYYDAWGNYLYRQYTGCVPLNQT